MSSREIKPGKNHFEKLLQVLSLKFNPKDLTLTLQFPKKRTISPDQPSDTDTEFVEEIVDLSSEEDEIQNKTSSQKEKRNTDNLVNDLNNSMNITTEEFQSGHISNENVISKIDEVENDEVEILETDLDDLAPSPKLVRIRISIKAYVKLALHSLKYANPNIPKRDWVEVIGLLTGYIENKDTPLARIIVTDAFPIGHGTDVNVQIQNPQSHVRVYQEKEKNNIIVGWYHSHPSYGAFMSQTDYQTQLRYQKLARSGEMTQPFALVIDPTRINKSSYGFKIFRLTNNYREWEEPRFEILNLETTGVPEMLETLLPLTEGRAMFLEYE
ncbi:MAG: Mov34/MPN/PAD-1 family protein [Candidatus Hodarchaeales archaeon]|jgi:proteasome lid subunit RPN8/RPN11